MSNEALPVTWIPDAPPQVKEAEVLHALGYGHHTPDPQTKRLVTDCIRQLSAVMQPRVVYCCLPVSMATQGLYLGNLLLPGRDLAAHIRGCKAALLFCATLSLPVDRLIRSVQVQNAAAALVLDSCATAAVEQLCDDAEHVMKQPYTDSFFPSRFSPGYGDLPLNVQKSILTLLDAPRRVGLCATDSHILTPRKSVTAIIGIGDQPVTDSRTGCHTCALRETCAYRKRGEFCGLSKTAD